jgi:hypothetical protein
MKALTILQPYAHLIAIGQKPIENRGWPTAYRGPLLIHAGKSTADVYGWGAPEYRVHGFGLDEMAFGAVVAVATVVACLPKPPRGDVHPAWVSAGYAHLWDHEHAHGLWCWVLADVQRLAEPVSCRGYQGLWNPDPHTILAVRAQMTQEVATR